MEADTKAKEERLRRQLLRTQRVEKKRTIRKYDEKVSEGFEDVKGERFEDLRNRRKGEWDEWLKGRKRG
jgi:hypothetical protein